MANSIPVKMATPRRIQTIPPEVLAGLEPHPKVAQGGAGKLGSKPLDAPG